MVTDIQKLIDTGSIVVTLPPGEYRGPFVINRPCTVEGNNTTLWNSGGAVMVINSPGVTLRNLRIEMIETSESSYSVCSLYPVSTDGVEIIGYTAGFGSEDTVPAMNRQLKLGTFCADEINEFCFEIFAPDNAFLKSELSDIRLEPSVLQPGINKIRILTDRIPPGTFIYGDILMKSAFNRRLYIQGTSSDGVEKSEGIQINTVNAGNSDLLRNNASAFIKKISERQSSKPAEPLPEKNNQSVIQENIQQKPEAVHILRRGERISIEAYSKKPLSIYMGYRALFSELDIDMYAFMLDENGVTSCDDDFVFFGNRETVSGALTFMDDKSVRTDLSRVPAHIKRISFVYSIYQPKSSDNFSKVLDPFISVVQDNREIVRYTASELFAETTIIFMDIYRHNSEWKLNTIGQGYRDGLKRLCANYGLIVS